MTASRLFAVVLIALGLAAVGVALAFLYKDFVAREGAWVDIHSYGPGELTPERRDEILEAWRAPDNTFPALIAGSGGVALFASGLMITVFESRCFQRRGPESGA